MKLVYIDTQIYRQYVNPGSDTKPLNKLKKLIDDKKIELVFPSQTKKEVSRNLVEALKSKESDLEKALEYYQNIITTKSSTKNNKSTLKQDKNIIKKIITLKKEFDKKLDKELKDFYKKKITELNSHYKTLDQMLKDIFKKATNFCDTDEIILRAVLRYAKDLPPKKGDHKFGDAIIWETLKDNIRKEELTIISKDGDFIQVEAKKILSSEWKKHTGKKITFYSSLGEFVNKLDPEKPISKETIQKEKIQTINSRMFSPVITKGLSYEIQGPTGPTGPTGPGGTFDLTTLGVYPSSIIGVGPLNNNNNQMLINPQYGNIITNSGILGVSAQSSVSFSNRKCTLCGNELPYDTLSISPIYCPVCGTFNH